jgi:CSLREA domain-containing protein
MSKTISRIGQAKRMVALLGLAMMAVMLISAKPAHAATTFTVNLTSDEGDTTKGDGQCGVVPSIPGPQCTLRAAIEEANATPGADTISFDIPGSGVQTIKPSSALPRIADPVTIDGYSPARPPTPWRRAPTRCSRPS